MQRCLDGSVANDPEELPGVKSGLGVQSQIAVPLEIAGTRRGVLTAQSGRPEFFSERDLRFVQAVSRWVGNVAHRAELAEQTAAAALERGRRLAADELVTVLAHDLRNHLTPIRAHIDILAKRARREEHLANVADTTKLRQSVDRLTRLISDLLDIARVDQGLFMASPEPLDLGYLLRDLRDALGSPEVSIEVHAPPELCALADPMRLRQALENPAGPDRLSVVGLQVGRHAPPVSISGAGADT